MQGTAWTSGVSLLVKRPGYLERFRVDLQDGVDAGALPVKRGDALNVHLSESMCSELSRGHGCLQPGNGYFFQMSVRASYFLVHYCSFFTGFYHVDVFPGDLLAPTIELLAALNKAHWVAVK